MFFPHPVWGGRTEDAEWWTGVQALIWISLTQKAEPPPSASRCSTRITATSPTVQLTPDRGWVFISVPVFYRGVISVPWADLGRKGNISVRVLYVPNNDFKSTIPPRKYTSTTCKKWVLLWISNACNHPEAIQTSFIYEPSCLIFKPSCVEKKRKKSNNTLCCLKV